MAAEVSGRLPVESIDELRAMHQRCELSAKELLSRRAMVVDVDGNLVPRLTEMIGKEFDKVSADNDRLSAEKSFSVLNKLHAKISERLDSSYYFKTGGYTDYQQDIGSMVREYMAAPGKGVKAFDVLDEFMVKQQIISKNVMHNDKHLTEQQKRAEEMEKQQEYLRREQEKMRRQVELAEQRAKDEARQRQEFTRSLEAKFEKERQEYRRQLSQLQPLLAREQERLKKEKAQEDAEEMAEALRQLRLRCQPPQSPQRRIVFF
jgi:myosin heavy subunit